MSLHTYYIIVETQKHEIISIEPMCAFNIRAAKKQAAKIKDKPENLTNCVYITKWEFAYL